MGSKVVPLEDFDTARARSCHIGHIAAGIDDQEIVCRRRNQLAGQKRRPEGGKVTVVVAPGLEDEIEIVGDRGIRSGNPGYRNACSPGARFEVDIVPESRLRPPGCRGSTHDPHLAAGMANARCTDEEFRLAIFIHVSRSQRIPEAAEIGRAIHGQIRNLIHICRGRAVPGRVRAIEQIDPAGRHFLQIQLRRLAAIDMEGHLQDGVRRPDDQFGAAVARQIGGMDRLPESASRRVGGNGKAKQCEFLIAGSQCVQHERPAMPQQGQRIVRRPVPGPAMEDVDGAFPFRQRIRRFDTGQAGRTDDQIIETVTVHVRDRQGLSQSIAPVGGGGAVGEGDDGGERLHHPADHAGVVPEDTDEVTRNLNVAGYPVQRAATDDDDLSGAGILACDIGPARRAQDQIHRPARIAQMTDGDRPAQLPVVVGDEADIVIIQGETVGRIPGIPAEQDIGLAGQMALWARRIAMIRSVTARLVLIRGTDDQVVDAVAVDIARGQGIADPPDVAAGGIDIPIVAQDLHVPLIHRFQVDYPVPVAIQGTKQQCHGAAAGTDVRAERPAAGETHGQILHAIAIEVAQGHGARHRKGIRPQHMQIGIRVRPGDRQYRHIPFQATASGTGRIRAGTDLEDMRALGKRPGGFPEAGHFTHAQEPARRDLRCRPANILRGYGQVQVAGNGGEEIGGQVKRITRIEHGIDADQLRHEIRRGFDENRVADPLLVSRTADEHPEPAGFDSTEPIIGVEAKVAHAQPARGNVFK